MRVMFFMLKKGISKTKFMITDLNMMMKRNKLGAKTLNKLLYSTFQTPPQSGEYEFSCRNSPSYPLSLFSIHKKHQNNRGANHNLPLSVNDCDDIIIDSAVFKALDMLIKADVSPMDSPLPLTQGGEDDHVDEAAEKFIRRFYNDRRSEA